MIIKALKTILILSCTFWCGFCFSQSNTNSGTITVKKNESQHYETKLAGRYGGTIYLDSILTYPLVEAYPALIVKFTMLVEANGKLVAYNSYNNKLTTEMINAIKKCHNGGEIQIVNAKAADSKNRIIPVNDVKYTLVKPSGKL